VTPAELLTAIVTEEGALRAPYGPALRDAMARREARRGEARSGEASAAAQQELAADEAPTASVGAAG
jgi:hypothetical protein